MLVLTRFVKIILIIVISVFIFFAGSYEVKQWGLSEVNQTIKQLLISDPAIKQITYANLNINLISALQDRWILTDVVIIPRDNPDYRLVLGGVSLERAHIQHGVLESFQLRIDDVFIRNLKQPLKLLNNFQPTLYFLINYQKDTKILKINMVIFNQLENLQTRFYIYQPVVLDRPIPVRLKNNPWITAWINQTPQKVLILNNPRLTALENKNDIKQIEPFLRIIQTSATYQEWLAYLGGVKSQTPMARP